MAPWLGVTALYVGLTLFYGWPLLGTLASALPHDAGDPALNAWILWWNAQALPLTERWWNAPMFHPAHGTFALSETLLGIAPLTTPLQWGGASAVVAYNVAFLASFPAAALASHALAHRLTGRHDTALIAGLAFGFSPYRAAQMPHLQMLWSCWMPLCLLGLHRYLDTRRARFLVLAGACWLINGLTNGYFLMFFAVLAGLWMIWFARAWRDWVWIGGALALASAALAPVLVGYMRHQGQLGLSRDTGEIAGFSADLSAVWATSRHIWPHQWTLQPRAEGELYPGAVVLVLAIGGAVVAWRRAGPVRWSRWRVTTAVVGGYLAEAALLTALLGPWRASIGGLRVSLTRPARTVFTGLCLLAVALVADARTRGAWRRRSALFFYTAAAVVMLVFALGPIGRLFGEAFWSAAPYGWLVDLPGGRALRVPARFAMLFVLCLSQAAALAFARLTPRGVQAPVVAGLAMAVFLEGWVPRLPTEAAAAPLELDATTVRHAVAVLELPVRDLYADTSAMLRATGHRLPVVNGFSGYSPPHYEPMREGLRAHDARTLDAIREFGPLLVLIHRASDPEGRHEQFVREQPRADLVEMTPLGPLYSLGARSRPIQSLGSSLAIASVEATVNPDLTAALTDGQLDTRWHTGPQVQDDRLTIVLDRPAHLSGLALDLGRFSRDYPRGLRIDVGSAGREPTMAWEGTTAGLAIAGILADRTRSSVVIPLPETAIGDRLVLTRIGEHSSAYWSIAELRVYGR